MRGGVRNGCLRLVIVLGAIAVLAAAFLILQARRSPLGEPTYVALGSSFAAGAGLGPLEKGSPLVCARSINGYPQQLARMLKLPIVDMSCGGATSVHVLHGGQFFQGPQLRVVDRRTRLVTITVGGNDIGYIGDLSMLAGRHTQTVFGRLIRAFWSGPKSEGQRDYAKVEDDLTTILRTIHERSPGAVIVLASYPTILPPSGTCPQLSMSSAEAALMREVAGQLVSVTRAAARKGGALFVDMNQLGESHHACSGQPWTRGWTNGGVAPFHPNMEGAQATAAAIAQALRSSPAAVATIREDNASRH